MGASTEKEKKSTVFDPRAWGLPSTAIKRLGSHLYELWERYADCEIDAARRRGESTRGFSDSV